MRQSPSRYALQLGLPGRFARLPLLMAGTRPAMTVRLVSFRAGRPMAAVNSQ
jgi:hypothetical protein